MTAAKVAIVVGGTGSIGSQVALKLAGAGCDVVLVFRSAQEKAAALKRQIEAMGRECLLVQADVTDPEAARRMAQSAVDRFGRIDSLISTQGWLHEMQLFQDDPLANMQKTIDVELWGVIHACKAVIPQMIKQKGGRIVPFASDSGKVGSSGEAISAAARGAVIALSKTLARELARYNINVNVVCPGPTESVLLDQMRTAPGLTGKIMGGMERAIPMRRPGRAEEVADLAVYLAVGDSTYITGQAISVSGGLTMC